MQNGRVTDKQLVIDLRETIHDTRKCYDQYAVLCEHMCYYDFMRDCVIGPALVEITNLGEGVDMLKEMIASYIPSERPGINERKANQQRFTLFNAVVPFMTHVYNRLSSVMNSPSFDVNLERFDEQLGYLYIVVPDYNLPGAT